MYRLDQILFTSEAFPFTLLCAFGIWKRLEIVRHGPDNMVKRLSLPCRGHKGAPLGVCVRFRDASVCKDVGRWPAYCLRRTLVVVIYYHAANSGPEALVALGQSLKRGTVCINLDACSMHPTSNCCDYPDINLLPSCRAQGVIGTSLCSPARQWSEEDGPARHTAVEPFRDHASIRASLTIRG